MKGYRGVVYAIFSVAFLFNGNLNDVFGIIFIIIGIIFAICAFDLTRWGKGPNKQPVKDEPKEATPTEINDNLDNLNKLK